MRVAIVSAGSPDYNDLRDVTQPTRTAYAQRHGYDAWFFETKKEHGDACKRLCYEQLWGKGYDLFVWMDLDSIIWNPTIRIESIVHGHMRADIWGIGPSAHETHFLWGYDHAGPNSGVYIARFTSEARLFMDRVYATMLECGWADETAAEQVMLIKGVGEIATTCPGYIFNAYPKELYYGDRYSHRINQLGDDSLVLHLPGMANEKRIPLLKKYADEARAKW